MCPITPSSISVIKPGFKCNLKLGSIYYIKPGLICPIEPY